MNELIAGLLAGNQRALSRLLTLVEQDGPDVPKIMAAAHPHTGKAYTIGITGPPGAGKSTLVDQLVRLVREEGRTVGILAVDPTSPFSGGAVLGDRIRMQRHYLDPGVFIRSMATRGSHGGLSRATRSAAKLLDAAGKDFVMVETVGVGQTELDIMEVVDTVIVVLVPEAGDAVQVMKAGLVEIADIFVVNKGDREGASETVTALNAMLSIAPHKEGWRTPVLLTKAHEGEGIPELYRQVQRHRQMMEESSNLETRRRERRRREFFETLEEWLAARVRNMVQQDQRLRDLVAQVETGEQDPHSAIAQITSNGSLLREWLSSLESAEGSASHT